LSTISLENQTLGLLTLPSSAWWQPESESYTEGHCNVPNWLL
jgi:hypothetical protein